MYELILSISMKLLIVTTFILLAVSCSSKKKTTIEERIKYEKEIDKWHETRIKNLKASNGWLNLAGLYWLHPGINTFGSGPKNDIIFPSGEIVSEAGYFLAKNGQVVLVTKSNASIKINQQLITQAVIFHPDSTRPIIAESGSLRWSIIKREDKLGVRLRDLESEFVKEFTGIDRFPVNANFQVEADFEFADSTHTIDITNVLGQTLPQHSPGTLSFELFGSRYRLDALEEKNELFIIFADATSGRETYGSGRFLYAKKPNGNGKVLIDFNKAYNPPCAFTPYATCPLPPKQNVLPIAIKAGEKNFSNPKEHHSLAI